MLQNFSFVLVERKKNRKKDRKKEKKERKERQKERKKRKRKKKRRIFLLLLFLSLGSFFVAAQ